MKMLSFLPFALIATATGHAQGFELMHQLRTNLSHATTYSWKPGPPPVAERLSAEHFHDQIDKDMKAKGWKLVPTGGDIVLSSSIIVTTIDEDDFNSEQRPNAETGNEMKTSDYAGNLPISSTARILTIVTYDAAAKKTLWEARVRIRLTKEFKDTLISVEKSADVLVGGFVPAGK